jgi:hypothetical protein
MPRKIPAGSKPDVAARAAERSATLSAARINRLKLAGALRLYTLRASLAPASRLAQLYIPQKAFVNQLLGSVTKPS